LQIIRSAKIKRSGFSQNIRSAKIERSDFLQNIRSAKIKHSDFSQNIRSAKIERSDFLQNIRSAKIKHNDFLQIIRSAKIKRSGFSQTQFFLDNANTWYTRRLMKKVSLIRYESPQTSVEAAIELSGAFDKLKTGDTVFVKPNIVCWSKHVPMPPWGVITTTRVLEDVLRHLRKQGAGRIIIGEGMITNDPKDRDTPAHAYETLGYNAIARLYDAEVINCFEESFRETDLGDGIRLSFSAALLDADFVVSLPVLKTHAQTKVSLSQKNLKGCLDMESRKFCHSDSMKKDLDFYVARLADMLPKSGTVTDGIYTLERGPIYTGNARRSNILIASSDLLAADIAGAACLGISPAGVPHIARACRRKGFEPGIESLELVGEPLENLASPHKWEFPYNEKGNLPSLFERMGIQGLSFPKYDHSLCSYCSGFIGLIQMAITKAWKGSAFDSVEILTGKMQRPTPGMKHTLLFGKCQVQLNKDHPDVRNPIKVPGCPPRVTKLASAFKAVGIEADPAIFENYEAAPALFMERYMKRPEFSHEFYRADGEFPL